MRHLLSLIAFLLSFCIHSQESFTFEHNGLTRNYLLTIPETLDAQTPLVFVLHGYGGNAQQMTYLGWQEISTSNNVMICYPNGTTDLFGSPHWNANLYTGEVPGIPEGTDDHGFLVSLSSHIQSTYQLSSGCVFSCGFSNGGFMSLSLACHEYEHFKAVGSVGGLMSDYDYNVDKKPAPASYTKKNGEKILDQAKKLVSEANPDHPDIAEKLFSDLGTNLQFEQSMRQFSSNPNTTIPNDQGAFADFCYGSMISCKEGNKFACARNLTRHTNY